MEASECVHAVTCGGVPWGSLFDRNSFQKLKRLLGPAQGSRICLFDLLLDLIPKALTQPQLASLTMRVGVSVGYDAKIAKEVYSSSVIQESLGP